VRTPRNRLAKLASTLDSRIGHHPWPAPLASTFNTTGQPHWPPQLVRTIGRHHWPGPLASCSKHVDDDDDVYNDDYDEDDVDVADVDGEDGGDGDEW